MSEASVEFYLGQDSVPSMRRAPGLHFRILLSALEKLNGGTVGGYTPNEVFELHKAKIEAVARARVNAAPDAPRPLLLGPEHF
ncbi:MAG TPA: hypothetical protein VF503_08900 [Sphingobium sp.]|uniref:hypothetical protein n=1 Tax=Sphingobium sp. TaxID=1912891 RepID=UPI002ED66956